MAKTGYLSTVVEEHVRAALGVQYGTTFAKKFLVLQTGGLHEFDAVSDDDKIVAGIKTAGGRTASGKVPSGKIKDCIAELYFLSLVQAPKRLLVLTSAEMLDIMTRTLKDKVAPGLQMVHVPLPADVQAMVAAIHADASAEVMPVLDDREQRAAGTEED